MVKIKDIAKAAGVSPSTVSEVLNGKERCYASKEKKERILKVAKELGYMANPLSRALKGLPTKSIGIISNLFDREMHNLLIGALSDEVNKTNYTLLLGDIKNSIDKEDIILKRLMSYGIDGLICCSTHDRNKFDNIIANKIPTIYVDTNTSKTDITVDRFHGAYLMGQHLSQLQHKKVCIVGASNKDSNQKTMGFAKAAAEAGDIEILYLKEQDNEAVLAEAHSLIKDGVTAFFALADRLAAPLMKGLINSGINVPKQVSIAGFNGMPYCDYLNPGLTTIRQPVEQVAEHAVLSLLNKIENNKNEPKSVSVKPELIIRESTAIPA